MPNLALYVHMPWCVQKCPYCDFNSHRQLGDIPQRPYIEALLADLRQDLTLITPQPLRSIFIGGGTPSLFDADQIHHLLTEVQGCIAFSPDCEITLEANPGTMEKAKFLAFAEAGISRLSIGVQSLQDEKLTALGRIHCADEALAAIKHALAVGFRSVNVDLMHGLPQQSLTDALADLQQVIDLGVPHISWYQLTLEPNTQFAKYPPLLPDEDVLTDIFLAGQALLVANGYRHYEVSAYAKPGHESAHNLNYWHFGDYLGIGCGAHSKLTQTAGVLRQSKLRHPTAYMAACGEYCAEQAMIEPEDMAFEYFLNRCRVFTPMAKAEFGALTQLDVACIAKPMAEALELGLITETPTHWILTAQGRLYLNQFISLFMVD